MVPLSQVYNEMWLFSFFINLIKSWYKFSFFTSFFKNLLIFFWFIFSLFFVYLPLTLLNLHSKFFMKSWISIFIEFFWGSVILRKLSKVSRNIIIAHSWLKYWNSYIAVWWIHWVSLTFPNFTQLTFVFLNFAIVWARTNRSSDCFTKIFTVSFKNYCRLSLKFCQDNFRSIFKWSRCRIFFLWFFFLFSNSSTNSI